MTPSYESGGLARPVSLRNLPGAPPRGGELDNICETLNEKQIEYVDLGTWGYVKNAFKGSAIISAVFREHEVLVQTDLIGGTCAPFNFNYTLTVQ